MHRNSDLRASVKQCHMLPAGRHKRASYRCRRLRYVFHEVCCWKRIPLIDRQSRLREISRSPNPAGKRVSIRRTTRTTTTTTTTTISELKDDWWQSRWNNSGTMVERRKGDEVENEGDAFAERFCSSLPSSSGKRGELTGEIECNRCNVRSTVGRLARDPCRFLGIGNRPENDGWKTSSPRFLASLVRISRA